MQITEVKVTLRDEDKLKAFASITFDDAFVIRGLKVISGSKVILSQCRVKRAKTENTMTSRTRLIMR